ncbi:MAG TPA: HEAT repeat domain-containing protein [Planctomycetota bacterium]|nr:HEAT repeat domain-containing protein [Planctomycetota bacterium]
MRKLLLVALAFSMSAGGFVLADDSKDKEVDDALAAFRKAYASKEESERVSAIQTLGAVQSKKVIDLLAHGLKDTAPAVKREAAKAIGGIWAKEAAPTLVKALNLDDTQKDVQVAIIHALGDTQSDAAVPALVSVLQPKRRGQATDDPYTGPALDALRKIGSALATDDLITFLTQESAGQGRGGGRRGGGNNNSSGKNDDYTRQAEAALKNITGQSYSAAADWRKWWNDNKDTLKKIQVYRCTGTGKPFDHVNSSTKCPNDGDQHPSCGYFLKTRFEAGGLGSGEDTKSSSSDEKKPRGNRNNNKNNNNNNGGNNN